MERYRRVALDDKTNTINYSNWELVKRGLPQSSILGPLCFLLYMNDLPTVTAENAKLVLYAADTSFIITSPNLIEFSDKVFTNGNEWFGNNLIFLNFNKTTYLQFRTKNSQKLSSNIKLLDNQITNSTNTKFLGLTIEETLSWKCHINQILSRLSSVCYAVKVIAPLMSEDILKIIFYSYVHSIITWCNFLGKLSTQY